MKMISRKIDGYLINLIQLGDVLEKLRWTGPTLKLLQLLEKFSYSVSHGTYRVSKREERRSSIVWERIWISKIAKLRVALFLGEEHFLELRSFSKLHDTLYSSYTQSPNFIIQFENTTPGGNQTHGSGSLTPYRNSLGLGFTLVRAPYRA